MPKTDSHFTKDLLHRLFEYKQGHLYWKEKKGRRTAGSLAGTKAQRYWQTCIDYVLYRNHRLIWVYHNGPCEGSIDHINGDTFDNRIENLRECSSTQNQYNRKKSKSNTSGVKGVGWSAQKQKWRARIIVDGREFHIGFFDTLKDAECAIFQKRQQVHGVFARQN